MNILEATKSGCIQKKQEEKYLFSLLISITPFYDVKNFNNDSQKIEIFLSNCFYFQYELYSTHMKEFYVL